MTMTDIMTMNMTITIIKIMTSTPQSLSNLISRYFHTIAIFFLTHTCAVYLENALSKIRVLLNDLNIYWCKIFHNVLLSNLKVTLICGQ